VARIGEVISTQLLFQILRKLVPQLLVPSLPRLQNLLVALRLGYIFELVVQDVESEVGVRRQDRLRVLQRINLLPSVGHFLIDSYLFEPGAPDVGKFGLHVFALQS